MVRTLFTQKVQTLLLGGKKRLPLFGGLPDPPKSLLGPPAGRDPAG